MASVIVMTDPSSDIEYSSASGRVRFFELRGEVLYDERKGIVADSWRDKLVAFVKEVGLDEDDGHGLHAFVYRLIDEGAIAPPDRSPREAPAAPTS